jgi:energy-converting hydrogenase Eha subunit A
LLFSSGALNGSEIMLAEPTTTLTDYAIALESTLLAVALLGQNKIQHDKLGLQRSRFFWGIAFGWVAIAAAAGGTCHGFAPILTLSLLNRLWTLTGYAIGCASFFMLLGATFSTFAGWIRWVAIVAISGKAALYLAQVGQYQQFVPMAIDYGSAMLVVVLLQWVQLERQRRSAIWISAGIGVSMIAIGIQATRISIAPSFNHNDLYHLVQMVALYLLYRGARILKDC